MHMAIASAFIGSSASRVLIALLVAGSVALFVVAITVLLGRNGAEPGAARDRHRVRGEQTAQRAAHHPRGQLPRPRIHQPGKVCGVQRFGREVEGTACPLLEDREYGRGNIVASPKAVGKSRRDRPSTSSTSAAA